MKQRALGATGLLVSEVAFGCGTTADLMINGAPAARRAAVQRALDLGINYFDTAPLYGNTASETNLGACLKDLEATPIIGTKVILGPENLDDIADAVRQSVIQSAARLQVQTLPLVQLHNRIGMQRAAKADVGAAPLLDMEDVFGADGVLEAFDWLRQRGIVQHIGCCAYGGETPALEKTIDSGAFDTVLVSYSMANSSAFDAHVSHPAIKNYQGIAARAHARGMGVIALRALEAGKLTRSDFVVSASASLGDRELAKAAQSLCRLLEVQNLPLVSTATRFALTESRIATLLVGISDIRHVEEAVDASMNGALDASVLSTIRDHKIAMLQGAA